MFITDIKYFIFVGTILNAVLLETLGHRESLTQPAFFKEVKGVKKLKLKYNKIICIIKVNNL